MLSHFRRVLLRLLASVALPALAAAAPVRAGTAVPRPDLARFLPADYRVTQVLHLRLDGVSVPEIAVAAVGTTADSPYPGIAPSTVLVLAWDTAAGRWTRVFDAAYEPSYQVQLQTGPTAPGLVALDPPHLAAIADQPGHAVDLLYWLPSIAGNSGVLKVGIVHYAHRRARLVYTLNGDEAQIGLFFQPGPQPPSGAAVIGSAPRQQVRITLPWLTQVDSRSTAARMFTFTLAPDAVDSYHLTATTQSYLGLGLNGATGAVACVDPHAPAAGVLRPGDVPLRVEGSALARQNEQYLLGPVVVEQVALHVPGDRIALQIKRGGHLQVVWARLVQWRAPSPCVPPRSAAYRLVL